MKFLKGLALGLLSFLLFLSLSIFGLALTLNYTILNPDFVVSELDKLDVYSLAKEQISQQILSEDEFMAEVVDKTLADLELWIKEQVSAGIYSGYDYFLGKSEGLRLVISLEPVKESLKEDLWQAILKSPPPELAGLPQAEMEQQFDEFYQEFTKGLPSTFEFSESSLSPKILAQVEQARQYISYFPLGYKVLIGFILLLVLGIILINHQVRSASRGLGTTFLTFGVPLYISIFVAKYFAGTQLTQLGIPPQLQRLLPQLLDDFLVPLEIFSIGLAAAGIILLIVSFAYKPRQPSF